MMRLFTFTKVATFRLRHANNVKNSCSSKVWESMNNFWGKCLYCIPSFIAQNIKQNIGQIKPYAVRTRENEQDEE